MNTRIESDTIGEISVDDANLWGAQTQRSLQNFAIGDERFPRDFIVRFAIVKKAAALVNNALGELPAEITAAIAGACDEIIAGQHSDQFPLVVWQTGSGTQTNMNLNEVIANRANELLGGKRGSHSPVHPNDHVNRSQSSNDVFPTVMNIAAVARIQEQLIPALTALVTSIRKKSRDFDEIIKCGRTHMMDATPITLGQEFSGYASQLEYARNQIASMLTSVKYLPIGGTAVGTGLNSHAKWAEMATAKISELTGVDFKPMENKFMGLAGHEALMDLHGRLRLLATVLFKIGSDLRLMASGPRAGLAEIILPANEPGSSIMPGKVNPTQIEVLTMVALQVMGNDTAVGMANSQGQFELNVFKPLIIYNVLQSIQLLSDAMRSFDKYCLSGLQPNTAQLRHYVERSLMMVTALTPHIGYDNAAEVAKLAQEKGLSLKEAVLNLGLLTADEYDRLVKPEAMLGPYSGE